MVGRTPARGKAGGHQESGVLRSSQPEPRDDARAEGEAGERVGQIGIARAQPGERGAGVFDLALQVRVLALARADAAEVEAQHDDPGAAQSARHAVDHLVVHGAAVERMRMAEHGDHARLAMVGLFEQGFELPGGTGESVRLDAARHD